MDRTGATMVVHNITWPQEMIYSSTAKPATYKELSVPAFVQGYLVVMDTVNTKTKDIMAKHLEDLMSDCDITGWENVRAYHGSCSTRWSRAAYPGDIYSDQILKFRRALVWHSTSPPYYTHLSTPRAVL